MPSKKEATQQKVKRIGRVSIAPAHRIGLGKFDLLRGSFGKAQASSCRSSNGYFLFCLVSIILSCLPSPVLGEQFRRVRGRELLGYIESGSSLNLCVINGEELASDIALLQKQFQKFPQARLELANCRIEGDLSLDEQHLFVTPISQLRARGYSSILLSRLEDRGIREVALIPIPVSLTDVRFVPLNPQEANKSVALTLGNLFSFPKKTIAFFTEDVELTECKFDDLNVFAAFTRNFGFRGNDVGGVARFTETVFGGSADFRPEITLRRSKRTFLTGVIQTTVFESSVDFNECVWLKEAEFQHVRFDYRTDFRNAVFERDANFSGIHSSGPSAKVLIALKEDANNFKAAHHVPLMDFEGAHFQGRVYFDEAKIFNVTFSASKYSWAGDAFQREAQATEPEVPPPGVSKDELARNATRGSEQKAAESSVLTYSPAFFYDRVIFRNATLGYADFADVQFRDFADFHDTTFEHLVLFRRATFEKDVDFNGANFCGELHLEGLRFQKPVGLRWEQISGHVPTVSTEGTITGCASAGSGQRRELVFKEELPREGRQPPSAEILLDLYSTLQTNLESIGDHEGAVEARYNRELCETSILRGKSNLRYVLNRCWFFLSGYNLRPLRILAWTFAVFAFFFLFAWLGDALQRSSKSDMSSEEYLVTQLLAEQRTSSFSTTLLATWRAAYDPNPTESFQQGPLSFVRFLMLKFVLVFLILTLIEVSPLLQAALRLLGF